VSARAVALEVEGRLAQVAERGLNATLSWSGLTPLSANGPSGETFTP